MGGPAAADRGPPRDPRDPRPGRSEPVWTGNEHVFGLCREQAGERLLVLANFTATPQPVGLAVARDRGFRLTEAAGEVDGRPIEGYRDFIVLAPYQHLWLPGDSQDSAARLAASVTAATGSATARSPACRSPP